tara:strand:+ start:367 stop:522 length:156 start_codon:yes stop_codon:yes gene_type:complete
MGNYLATIFLKTSWIGNVKNLSSVFLLTEYGYLFKVVRSLADFMLRTQRVI